MNKLSRDKQKQLVAALVEGNSIRATCRMTGAAKGTVLKLSKKVENLEHAVALHFMHYNFCRIHQSLRVTPAMAAGVTDHIWEIEEILNLMP